MVAAVASSAEWQVYLVRCRDGRLYAGISTDVQRRFEQHANGSGAKALRGRGPLTLAASEPVGDRSQAQQVEARIKRLSKQQKEQVLATPGGLRALVRAVVEPPGDSDQASTEDVSG